MDWKCRSNDCESVSRHDCDITEWRFEEGELSLIFEYGFDIYAENHLNGTGRHKRTGEAAVVLKNAEFLSAEYPEYTVGDKLMPAEKIGLNEVLPLELEVFGFGYENGVFSMECCVHHSRKFYCCVDFSCAELLFCWNELTDDAWFQR